MWLGFSFWDGTLTIFGKILTDVVTTSSSSSISSTSSAVARDEVALAFVLGLDSRSFGFGLWASSVVTLGYPNWRLRFIVMRVVNVQHYSEAPILCVLPASLADIWFSINVMPLFDPLDQMCYFLFVSTRPTAPWFDKPPQKVRAAHLVLQVRVEVHGSNLGRKTTTADNQKLSKPHTHELTFYMRSWAKVLAMS